jgi:N utilization substance protein B
MNKSRIKHHRLVRKLAVQFIYQQDAQNRQRLSEEDFTDFLNLQPEKIEPEAVTELRDFSEKILKNLKVLDEHIQENVKPEWPFERIARMDLSILRVGCAELLWNEQTHPHVILSEAVLLADDFCEAASIGYINGILSMIAKKVRKDNGSDASAEK